jgi:hypothetical protein
METIIPYEKLPDGNKQMLMSYAAHWLSMKPDLIGDVGTDKELIDRLISFAKVLYEYFPEYKRTGGSSVGSVPTGGV